MKNETVQITTYVDRETAKRIRKAAEGAERSVAWWVKAAIGAALGSEQTGEAGTDRKRKAAEAGDSDVRKNRTAEVADLPGNWGEMSTSQRSAWMREHRA